MVVAWIFAAISIFGAILNAKKNKWGFIVWIMGSGCWIFVNIVCGLYEQIPVWIILGLTSAYGFVKWTNEEKLQ